MLWLQSKEWYADIRVPTADADEARGPEARFARPWAFAGTATWDPPMMSWEHVLDSDVEPAPDANELQLDGDIALERGEIEWEGRALPFCEEWQRIGPADAVGSVEVDANRIDIVVGRWRIAILDERPYGPFRASRYERGDGKWQASGQVHFPAE